MARTILLPKHPRGIPLDIYLGFEEYVTRDWKSNPALHADDFKLSKDGGTLNALGTTPTVAPASSIQVKIPLSASELDCRWARVTGADVTTQKDWEDFEILIPLMNTVAMQVVTNGGSNTAIAFKTNLPTRGTDWCKNMWLHIWDGSLRAESQQISAFNNSTGVVTLNRALSGTPADDVWAWLVNQ